MYYLLRYYLQSFNIWYTKTSNCKLNFTLQNIVYWMNYFSVDKKTLTFDPKVLPTTVWAGYALTIRINCIIMLSGMQLSLTIPHNLIICSMIKFEANILWISILYRRKLENVEKFHWHQIYKWNDKNRLLGNLWNVDS